MNDNNHTETDDEIDAWLTRANTALITSSAQDLDIDAMLIRAKRAAVTTLGSARTKPRHAWRSAAHDAAGIVDGALAFKPPDPLLPDRTAKVIQLHRGEAADGDSLSASEHAHFDALLAQSVAGEYAAVDELLAAVRPLVVRYCRARVEREADADDVAQETLVAVLTALPRYQEHARPFLQFVYDIASHKVTDARREAARRREVATGLVSDVLEGIDGSALPEGQLLNTELNEQMSKLLQLLPDRLREVIVLRIVVGLTTEETAAAIGTSPGAVRIDQHRALRRLQQALADRKIR